MAYKFNPLAFVRQCFLIYKIYIYNGVCEIILS